MKKSFAVAVVASLALSPFAQAASGTLINFSTPDPASGSGCTRHTVVGYDTTKTPPAWSNGYVVCDG